MKFFHLPSLEVYTKMTEYPWQIAKYGWSLGSEGNHLIKY